MTATSRPTIRHAVLIGLLALPALPSAASAQVARTLSDVATRDGGWTFSEVQQRGIDFLLGKQKEGLFFQNGKPHAGQTALALGAVLTKPAELRNQRETAYIDAASKWLMSQQNDDGSFGDSLHNYQTSAVVLALAAIDSDASRAALAKAQKYLVYAQIAEQHASSSDDAMYGGFGYSAGGGRADLSNTQFAVEALRATGLEPGHEAYARAIKFLQRVQNLRNVNDHRSEISEEGSDETYPVESGNDGGAAYRPGDSKFGYDVVEGGVRVPRSYGSMTYALLKTYALCGLPADDPRMKAASDWLRRNWTVESNPGSYAGMDENTKYQGLFYYYQTMAKALTVCGIDDVEPLGASDELPKQVDWRRALRAKLIAEQRGNGSWLNTMNGRWWEDQAVMCTVYALLALAEC